MLILNLCFWGRKIFSDYFGTTAAEDLQILMTAANLVGEMALNDYENDIRK